MLDNEDSVVTSLNELRKLKHERITRQTQSRAVVGAGRAAALAVDPVSDQMTPPPMSVSAYSQAAPFRHAPAQNLNAGFGGPGGNAGTFSAQGASYASSPPIIQTKTSYTAAVVIAILLVGAGGVGYMKLQTDTQAMLAAKEVAIKRAEESRVAAAALAARSDVQTRNNLRQCEDKLKAALAVAPAAAASVAPSAPAVEKQQEKLAVAKVVAARAPNHKPAARPGRHAQAEPAAAPKAADVPTIAKKKKLDNDPLAGLNKL